MLPMEGPIKARGSHGGEQGGGDGGGLATRVGAGGVRSRPVLGTSKGPGYRGPRGLVAGAPPVLGPREGSGQQRQQDRRGELGGCGSGELGGILVAW